MGFYVAPDYNYWSSGPWTGSILHLHSNKTKNVLSATCSSLFSSSSLVVCGIIVLPFALVPYRFSPCSFPPSSFYSFSAFFMSVLPSQTFSLTCTLTFKVHKCWLMNVGTSCQTLPVASQLCINLLFLQ